MLKAIGTIVTKKPKTVIILMLVFMTIAGVLGGGVVSNLTGGGLDDSSSPSIKAAERLSQGFGQTDSNVVLVITAKNGTVDSPAVAAAALTEVQKLRNTRYMEQVSSYWTAGKSASLRSGDGKQALIIGTLAGNDDQTDARIATIASKFTTGNSQITVGVGGVAEMSYQFSQEIERGLKIAELISLPLMFIIMLFVFRSVVAALLPLLIGGFAVLGTLFTLFILTKFTSVSVYALNLTTMLGLGLAVDYSLFTVSRFREQLKAGDQVDVAVKRTVQHAGRTVFFSALTVAASLSALLIFPQPFLRSFAYAGIAVSIIAAAGSVLFLSSILRLLGSRINTLPIGRKISPELGGHFWRRVATIVMKRPIVIGLTAIILLLFLGTPFLSINLGRSDEHSLPKANPVRLVQGQIDSNFSSQETSAIQVVSAGITNVNPMTITTYATALSKLNDIDHVEASTGIYADGKKVAPGIASQYLVAQGTWLSVVTNVNPKSPAAEKIVSEVRSAPAPFAIYTGGQTATVLDLKQSITHYLPYALVIISVIMFILLFLMFGGILIPIKALVINALSLSATFGVMVWVFQEGHFSGVLNFTPTGVIDATMPILMFCIAFGLSMDYEVFLLSRIKEYYDKTGDNREAVAHGLEKTGGIVTAAAITISVVFVAFGTSGVSNIKMFGLILAFAVLLDAFIIRGTLVPAFMRLAGNANWWSPKLLKRFYERHGISRGVKSDRSL